MTGLAARKRTPRRDRSPSARGSVIARDEIIPGVHRTWSQEPGFAGFTDVWRTPMTKLTFVAAALIAAAAYSAQASAAGSNAASRRGQAATTSKTGDCVRAPNVGSYATAPYTQPPCMPGTMR